MKFSILGAGSWGTALAIQIARNNEAVLWGRDSVLIRDMQKNRVNQRYLPEVKFPDSLRIESELEKAINLSDAVLVVCPSHAFASVLKEIKSLLGGRPLAWASKGFEPGTGRFLHQVAENVLQPEIPTALITGPSFAKDVANNKPTLVAVASRFSDFAEKLAKVLHSKNFRVYISSDIIGAELGGAVKNVLALATGIADGMGLGDNTRAALLTRGLAEMLRLGEALGCQTETLMGLAGLGDLVLTSTGDLSRNRRMGFALGKGQTVEQAQEEIDQVVEGIGTAEEVMRLARKHNVDMPISEQVWRVVNGHITPQQALKELMSREIKPEFEI